MMTIREVCKAVGVSARTLRHYDAIGLMKPARVGDNGYRYYDAASVERLREIRLLRESGLSLREIEAVLSAPAAQRDALDKHIASLEREQARLGARLILARAIRDSGGMYMDIKKFDTGSFDDYGAEARARWGKTEAWRQYEARAGAASGEDRKLGADALMALLSRFGTLRGADPAGEDAREAVRALQNFITENYYDCTDDILAALGGMYVEDERFRKNIDACGGEGTAACAAEAIRAYCAANAGAE